MKMNILLFNIFLIYIFNKIKDKMKTYIYTEFLKFKITIDIYQIESVYQKIKLIKKSFSNFILSNKIIPIFINIQLLDDYNPIIIANEFQKKIIKNLTEKRK
jgi:hypothetical protein